MIFYACLIAACSVLMINIKYKKIPQLCLVTIDLSLFLALTSCFLSEKNSVPELHEPHEGEEKRC